MEESRTLHSEKQFPELHFRCLNPTNYLDTFCSRLRLWEGVLSPPLKTPNFLGIEIAQG